MPHRIPVICLPCQVPMRLYCVTPGDRFINYQVEFKCAKCGWKRKYVARSLPTLAPINDRNSAPSQYQRLE